MTAPDDPAALDGAAVDTRLLVDRETMLPGCVLLQAAAGCDVTWVSENVASELWLTFQTEQMAVAELTSEQAGRYRDLLAERQQKMSAAPAGGSKPKG